MIISSALIGITGFMIIENYTFVEAFYMTVITVTTVGFLEVHPLSEAGRIFTALLSIIGIGIFFYGVTAIIGFIVEGEFRNFFKNYKMTKRIDKLNNHVIVCGYGRNGKQVCDELADDKQCFVLLEINPDALEEYKQSEYNLFIEGNATEDEVLIEAGIERAKALITTLPKDPDNVYVVLTARELNPNITIISRASIETSMTKLKHAGANNVIMPEKIGGAYMASLVMKPDIMEFIAQLTGQDSDISLDFEELPLSCLSIESSRKSIRDLDVRYKTGANIIGLKNKDGEFIINPHPETKICAKDSLIILGSGKQIQAMKNLISKL
jgi:voltage-gated potassium channel